MSHFEDIILDPEVRPDSSNQINDSVNNKEQVFLSDDEIDTESNSGVNNASINYDLIRLIDQLSELKESKIQDEITPPSEYSYLIAELILNDLKNDFNLPTRISHSAEGGLCLTFKKSSQALYLEIYNDGEIGIIVEDFKNKKIITNKEITIKEVNYSIKAFLLIE